MTCRHWWTCWTIIALCWGAVWLGSEHPDARELGACMLIAGIILIGFWWLCRHTPRSGGRGEYFAIVLAAVLGVLLYRGPIHTGRLERDRNATNEQFAMQLARTIVLERSR